MYVTKSLEGLVSPGVKAGHWVAVGDESGDLWPGQTLMMKPPL